jgi:parallel beta-helix repeat protein
VILGLAFSKPSPKRSRKRVLLLLSVCALAAGLLAARPWQREQPQCVINVRPGESVQAAIDSAEPGAVICLGRGAWSENLVIDKPLTLLGSGIDKSIIGTAMALTPTIAVLTQHDEPGEVKLERLTISGPGGECGVAIGGQVVVELNSCRVSGRSYGIEAADSAHLIVSESAISENKQRGVILLDSARASISGSRISENLGLGFWLSGSAEATLVNCEISDNGNHGLWLNNEARVVLSNCQVSNNQGHGLWLTSQTRAELRSSHISGNRDQGVRAQDSATLEVNRSQVLSNWHGVELRNRARATIADSTISGSKWDGIRIQHSCQALVSGSTISANARGVGLSGEASADIRNCTVEGSSGYGIFSRSSSEVGGEGNEFRGNGVDLAGNMAGVLRLPLQQPTEAEIVWPDDRYASLQQAIDALIPGGRLFLNEGNHQGGLTIGKQLSIESADGVAILQATSTALPVLSLVGGADLRLARVTISGGSEGMLVSSDAIVAAVGCNFSENVEGINIAYSARVELTDCGIVRSEQRGAFIGGTARASITGCSISNNGGHGIDVADFATVTIADSSVTHSGREGGIVLWGSCQAILEGNTVADNRGFGIVIYERPCFWESPWVFQGHITGRSNVFRANLRGDVCPPQLGFLSTAEGGELDLMSPSSW